MQRIIQQRQDNLPKPRSLTQMTVNPPLALIMAAGFSRRFKTDKRFATLADGQGVLEKTLQNIVASGLDYRLAIKEKDLALALMQTLPAEKLLILKNSHKGLGHSIRDAIAAIEKDHDSVLICLADMPTIKPATYKHIADTLIQGDYDALIPCYRSQSGNPVAIKRQFFSAFKQLQGDKGGKKVLQADDEKCFRLEIDDPGIIIDIDIPEDLADL